MPDFLEVRLDSISVTNAGFIVFLKLDQGHLNEARDRVLPIFIGANEAQSIALALGEDPPPRPMTHDLLKSMLESLDAAVTRVDITDLKVGTFFAKIHALRGEIEETEFDSRPSDAIALALRFEAPIFVARHVFEEAAVTVIVKSTDDTDEDAVETIELAEGDDTGTDPEGSPEETSSPRGAPAHSAASPTSPTSAADKLRAELNTAVAAERYEDAARLRDALKKLGAEN